MMLTENMIAAFKGNNVPLQDSTMSRAQPAPCCIASEQRTGLQKYFLLKAQPFSKTWSLTVAPESMAASPILTFCCENASSRFPLNAFLNGFVRLDPNGHTEAHCRPHDLSIPFPLSACKLPNATPEVELTTAAAIFKIETAEILQAECLRFRGPL
jgi:hypothetical protein